MTRVRTLYERLFSTFTHMHNEVWSNRLRLGAGVAFAAIHAGSPYHTTERCGGHLTSLCGERIGHNPAMSSRLEQPFKAMGWPKCKRCVACERRREREQLAEGRVDA